MPDDAPHDAPPPLPPLAPALRFGAGVLVAGVLGELALRALLGRLPGGESDYAGMIGFWFVAAVLVVAMRLRPRRPRA